MIYTTFIVITRLPSQLPSSVAWPRLIHTLVFFLTIGVKQRNKFDPHSVQANHVDLMFGFINFLNIRSLLVGCVSFVVFATKCVAMVV